MITGSMNTSMVTSMVTRPMGSSKDTFNNPNTQIYNTSNFLSNTSRALTAFSNPLTSPPPATSTISPPVAAATCPKNTMNLLNFENVGFQ